MNRAAPFRSPAAENAVWPSRPPPRGTYRVYVNHYAIHERTQNSSVNETPFTVRILVRGRTQDFRGTVKYPGGKKLAHEFVLQ